MTNNHRRSKPSDVAFYWELSGPEGEAEHEVALEDEGYLANDLIRGTELLSLKEQYEACPSEVELPDSDIDDYRYSDAIASILQVAAWHGLDPDEIAAVALNTRSSVYEYSLSAAACRKHAVASSTTELLHPPGGRRRSR